MQCKPNDYWYTPDYILKAVKEFLGDDYLDPCPINPEHDGLISRWDRNTFINPPYSKQLRKAFVSKGIAEYTERTYSTADSTLRYLWLLNNGINKDTTLLHKYASATCVPYKRIRFIPGHIDLIESSPRYNSVFILLGDPRGFAEAFKNIGRVYNSI